MKGAIVPQILLGTIRVCKKEVIVLVSGIQILSYVPNAIKLFSIGYLGSEISPKF